MTLESSRDLGHGVRVIPADGSSLVVVSESVLFDWRPRTPNRPGSAVTFDGEGFEVVDRQPRGRGAQWTLEPWAGSDVMRMVSALDEAAVDAAAAAARTEAQGDRLRPALWLLSPVLGFADDSWQRRWRDEWGFPAVFATWLSAAIELLYAAACLMEIISWMGAGRSIFPWIPRPLVFLGLYLFVEGLIRVVKVSADSEPVGSLFGVIALFFERKRPATATSVPGPKVESFDEVSGVLELRSPILRRDWEEPGLLPFRGAVFELDGARQLGDSWIYAFNRVESEDGEEPSRLRLPPPPSKIEAPVRREEHGLVKTVLLSVACTIAPARFQERWAWWVGGRAVGFTIAGAAVELLGGIHGLGSGVSPGGAGVLVNLFFVGEAVVRLGRVMLTRQPMGSLLGLPLTPLLEKALPD